MAELIFYFRGKKIHVVATILLVKTTYIINQYENVISIRIYNIYSDVCFKRSVYRELTTRRVIHRIKI